MTLIPKTTAVRDEAYRRYLHEQPCRRCGAMPCQAAHLGHSTTSRKPGDDLCVSLCDVHHREMDQAFEGKEKWWVTQVVIPEEKEKYRRWKENAANS